MNEDEVVNDNTPEPGKAAKPVDLLEALTMVEKGLANIGAYQEAMIIKGARAHIEELRRQLEAIKTTPKSEPATEAAE